MFISLRAFINLVHSLKRVYYASFILSKIINTENVLKCFKFRKVNDQICHKSNNIIIMLINRL